MLSMAGTGDAKDSPGLVGRMNAMAQESIFEAVSFGFVPGYTLVGPLVWVLLIVGLTGLLVSLLKR